jgi:site-specific recombinase XerD
MKEILLSELIEQTSNCIRSFEHSQSTFYQYQLGWRAFTEYFYENHQVTFSTQLAEKYICELKVKLDAGSIKMWRYQLYRISVCWLIEYFEKGNVIWKYHKQARTNQISQPAYILLQKEYLDNLKIEGISYSTIQHYANISRQFLKYLEQQKINNITDIQLDHIRLFIPFISKRYQPTSMGTVFSRMRSFLRFVEKKDGTLPYLSGVIPSSRVIKTGIIPTITPAEEQKLLKSVDTTTPGGKRNYAMLLLALRTGLRSIDIIQLKLKDIHWENNFIEIVQEKTNVPLVLPLLIDVGNAIADYILNGRPDSQLPYIFLRIQAPFQNLADHAACYGISDKIMKEAGIRQGKGERRGFHCLRHSVAARLLAEETPLPVISSILGHRDKDSTKVYLSTDLEHLRMCGLNLNGIEVNQEELQ